MAVADRQLADDITIGLGRVALEGLHQSEQQRQHGCQHSARDGQCLATGLLCCHAPSPGKDGRRADEDARRPGAPMRAKPMGRVSVSIGSESWDRGPHDHWGMLVVRPSQEANRLLAYAPPTNYWQTRAAVLSAFQVERQGPPPKGRSRSSGEPQRYELLHPRIAWQRRHFAAEIAVLSMSSWLHFVP
ncbi:protein of unknown function [Stenotrophomonas maltophilia]|nr:protein of unknown function [Stenotrophomonas maltophilia]